jgi:hypothetical protein
MSFTFTQQPASIVGANSPIIYQAFDTVNYSTANYRYVFEVYVWSGTTSIPATPIVTINRLPDQYGGGRAWIDVHKIVQQYITSEFLINGTYKPNIGSGVKRVAVKCQGFILTSAVTSVITSTLSLATKGYTYTAEGFNVGFSKSVFTDKTAVYVTSETTNAYLWYDASVITSITCGSATVTPNAVTTSDQVFQGIEIKQLMTAGGVWGTNANITFVKAGDDVVMPVVFDCQNKYGQQDVLFLNRYGVYDSYLFNGVSRRTYAVTNEEYSQPIFKQADLAQSWSYGVQIGTPFLKNSTEVMTVNTDWIPETDVPIVEQIFYSTNVLILSGNNVLSTRVIDTAFEFKKRTNEKLIQYTIQLEYNQPKINKIVR